MMVDRANGGVITFNYDTHFRNHEGRFAIVPEWPPEKSSLRACKIPKNTIFHIHYNNNGIRQRVLRAAEDGKNKNWDSNIHYDSKSISKCERPLCEDNCDVMRLPERRFKHIRLIQEDKKFQFEAQNFFHVKVVFTDGQKIIARSTADPKSGMVIDLATRQQYHFPWPENTIAFAFFYLEIPHKENKNVKQKFEWSSDWEYIGTKIEPDYENVPIGPSTTTVPTDILEESDCVKGRNKKRCTYAGIGAGVATLVFLLELFVHQCFLREMDDDEDGPKLSLSGEDFVSEDDDDSPNEKAKFNNEPVQGTGLGCKQFFEEIK